MKVLHILPFSDAPNSMIFSKRQIASLSDHGFECEIFYLKARFNPIQLIQQVLELRRHIALSKFDLVHCHYGTITSFISLLGASSIPFVVTFHGSDVNGANDISKLRSSLGVFLSKFTSRFTSSNIVSNESLKIKLPVSAQRKSTVVPMGINIHVFKPIDRSACRKKLNWKDDEFVVLFNANNPIVKRLDIALDVKQRLESMHSDIRFEILSGHVDSDLIPTLLNAVNCVLVCSDSEGSPTIVKEALACNTSVVSNDVGDVKTRITGVTGCYLCEQNPEAYVASILKLYHSKEPCNGIDKIMKDELTNEQITRKIISVYSEAVKR